MDAQSDLKKKIGYVLFIIGIIIIAYTVGSVLLVFSGYGNVPVNFFEKEKDCSEYCNEQYNDMLGQIENGTPSINFDMNDYMSDIYPMYNLMIWLSLSFILLFAGYFLCKIGLSAISDKTIPKQEKKRIIIDKSYDNKPNDKNIVNNNYEKVDNENFENRPK